VQLLPVLYQCPTAPSPQAGRPLPLVAQANHAV